MTSLNLNTILINLPILKFKKNLVTNLEHGGISRPANPRLPPEALRALAHVNRQPRSMFYA
jgi:hypothetical protein